MQVSVGIITHNDCEGLRKCLKSLQDQTLSPAEIIVIDNASTDSTWKFLEARKDLVCAKRETNNIAEARNDVINLAQWKLLAFLDSDCEAPPQWLESLAECFAVTQKQDFNLAGVGGSQRFPAQESDFFSALEQMSHSIFGHGYSLQMWRPKQNIFVDHLPTTNVLFSVEHLKKVGGFDPRFSQVCEDVELGWRFKQEGMSMIFNAKIWVLHRTAYNLNSWCRRLYKFGSGHWLVALKHKDYRPKRLRFLFLVTLSPLIPLFIFLYVIVLLLESCRIGMNHRQAFLIARLMFWTHVYYVRGLLRGCIQFRRISQASNIF